MATVTIFAAVASALPWQTLASRTIASAAGVSDGTILTVYVAGAGGSFSPATDLFTVNQDLSFGTADPRVRLLQAYLNTHGFPVAAIGAGSLGNETSYFGQATQSALIRFQRGNNITPASGYFGMITRAYIARHDGTQQ